MEEKRRSDNVKNMLCFIPFFSIAVHFIEKNKPERLKKSIIYSWILLWLFLLPAIIFGKVVAFFLFMVYIWASVLFGYKSYIWEDIEISFIDKAFFNKK